MSASFGTTGGSGTVKVKADPSCAWTATSGVAWIRITAAASGKGDGDVRYVVDANLTLGKRTGILTVAGQGVTVTQAGIAP